MKYYFDLTLLIIQSALLVFLAIVGSLVLYAGAMLAAFSPIILIVYMIVNSTN